LSSARNTGMAAATGEIVAYIDDDAYPDPHWLTYLAAAFLTTDHAGIGGPNLPPAGDGWIADCVANAPGGPVHVLLSDTQAEHIPGCNMAFRKAALEAIGGFDMRFRVAGDDVHMCWLLQEHGKTLGFSPGALVWHHRRNSVRAYWKQQKGYGKAEALLEQRWPEKYNLLGHLSWRGRVYGKGAVQLLNLRPARIYVGTWGSASFQSLYAPAPDTLSTVFAMPEWYLVVLLLAACTALGASWPPLLASGGLLALGLSVTLLQAVRGAALASFSSKPGSALSKLKLFGLTAFLHLMQPLARLSGRLRHGLTPWRQVSGVLSAPWPRTLSLWSEEWRSSEERLATLEAALRSAGARLRRGGDYDAWDLEVHSGVFGSARLLLTSEEHGAGHQLIRVRLWPRCHAFTLVVLALLGVLAVAAAGDAAWVASGAFALAASLVAFRAALECAAAIGVARDRACRRQPFTTLIPRLGFLAHSRVPD
jgi:hypothetical protein